MQLPFTANDVDSLLASGVLSVSGSHRWIKGNNRNFFALAAEVSGAPTGRVELRMQVNRLLPDVRTICLLWNRVNIRRLDFNGSHANKHTNAELWKWRTHLHVWTDNCWDRFAVTPKDEFGASIQEQFAAFCAVAGITSLATIPDLPVQGELFDEV